MDTSEIKKLIEAFYNGETSTEEEQKLSDYFNGDNIDKELQDEGKLFLDMYKKEPIETPSMLEQKLGNLIDELSQQEKAKNKPNKTRLWARIGSIAAGLALLISVGIYMNKEKTTTTPDNPNLANTEISEEDRQKMKEAQDALLLLSSNFNKGVKQLASVSDNLDKTNDILNKTFNTKNEKNL